MHQAHQLLTVVSINTPWKVSISSTVDIANVAVLNALYNFLFTNQIKMKAISNVHQNELNPLQARWPMEPALISSFCSVKRMRVFDSPWMEH